MIDSVEKYHIEWCSRLSYDLSDRPYEAVYSYSILKDAMVHVSLLNYA